MAIVFNKKQTKIDAAPGEIMHDSKRLYFEMHEKLAIERNRYFVVCCVLSIVLLLLSATLMTLLPLKQVDVYLANQEPSGELVVNRQAIGQWQPNSEALTYFLSKWVNSVYDVNPSTIDQMIQQSSQLTIGAAKSQLHEMRLADNPLLHLRQVPNYTRTYEFKSINFVNSDTALIRFKTVTRSGDDVQHNTYLMSITFVREKPKTIEEVIKNPAGLYISHFTVSSESSALEKIKKSEKPDAIVKKTAIYKESIR